MKLPLRVEGDRATIGGGESRCVWVTAALFDFRNAGVTSRAEREDLIEALLDLGWSSSFEGKGTPESKDCAAANARLLATPEGVDRPIEPGGDCGLDRGGIGEGRDDEDAAGSISIDKVSALGTFREDVGASNTEWACDRGEEIFAPLGILFRSEVPSREAWRRDSGRFRAVELQGSTSRRKYLVPNGREKGLLSGSYKKNKI